MLVRRLIVAAVFFVAVVVGGAGPQSPLSLETPHLAEAANTRTWTGGGANSNWTNAANWGGTAPVAGDVLRFPSGAMRMSNTNDFPAGTSFDQIQFSGTAGGYVLSGNGLSLATALSTAHTGGTDAISLSISGPGGVDIHGGGRLELSGNNSFGGGIGVQKGALRVKSNHALGSTLGNTVVDATAAAGGGLEFEGDLDIAESIELDGSNGNLLRVISGFVALTNGLYISNPSCGIEVLANAQLGIIGDVSMGDIQKRGPGQLVIKGNVAGIFNANEGISVLRGNGSAFKMTGGDASIDGAVGLFNGTGGRWLTDTEFPATVHGATTFGAGFTFEMDRVQSATAAQAGLVAEQAPSLNGAHLSLLRSGDVGPPGSVLHLINNTSGQAVNGSFSGLPEGAMVSASQGSMASFRISYAGGDGNDITLTVVGASAADSADLGLTGSGSPEPATAGANVTYSVQVANFGPSDAHDVVFTAQVVAGSSFVALNASSNWSCTFPSVGATGQVRCTRDTLALNGGSTIMLRVTIDSARTANLVTAFHVAASTADPALANNDLSVTAHIGTAAPPPGPGSGSALPYRRFVMQVAQD